MCLVALWDFTHSQLLLLQLMAREPQASPSCVAEMEKECLWSAEAHLRRPCSRRVRGGGVSRGTSQADSRMWEPAGATLARRGLFFKTSSHSFLFSLKTGPWVYCRTFGKT